MASATQPSHSDMWRPTNLKFDLQPRQPPKIRRGWERVPVKAAGATQQKERKVWKRPEHKAFHYETEYGGAGFAISGAKRVRTQNMPALPVKKSARRDRAEEAEAQDELFARRRKSARLSSLNLQKVEGPVSPTKRRLEARRTIKTRDSLRSPLKDLRMMALTHNAKARKPRSSISNVLQSGTPMRQVFAERESSQLANSTPRPNMEGILGNGTPMRFAFDDQENRIPLDGPKDLDPPDVQTQFDFPSVEVQQSPKNIHSRTENIGEASPITSRRRSHRLSSQRASLEAVSQAIGSPESVAAGCTTKIADHDNIPTDMDAASSPTSYKEDVASDEDLIHEQIAVEIEAADSATPSPSHGPATERPETQAGIQGEQANELGSPASEVHATNTSKMESGSLETEPAKPDMTCLPVQENVLSVLQTVLAKDDVDIEYDSANMSEDELADNTITKMFTFSAAPEHDEPEFSPWRSKAPRLSDDTSIIKDFLNRTQAKRVAQAEAAQLLSAKLGPSIQLSPRRSPRRAVVAPPKDSPSLAKQSVVRRKIGTPAKVAAPLTRDGEESDELCSPTKGTRKSARKTPAPSRLGMSAPSMIPLRRPSGQEPVKLRKTETHEVALATRTNTRRNKGLAKMPREVLDDLCKKELSPIKSGSGRNRAAKAVDWQKELVSYLGPEKTRGAKVEKAKRSKGLGTVNGTPAKAKMSRIEGGGPLSIASRKTRSAQS